MENFLDISVIEVQEVEISNVIDPEGEYEVEVIDPMEYMFDNLMKKIDSNPANRGQAVALLQPAPPASGVCTLAASSASAGTVAALHPEAGSLHTPSSLESREHSIIRQVDETYLTENTVLVMRLKKDIDELKNKKIVEMEELLELKSKKEEARAELEAIKTDIAKHQTFFSSLKQFNDQTAAEEREREAAATSASVSAASPRVLLPPASDPSRIQIIQPRAASTSSTSTSAQPQLPDLVNHDGQPRPAVGAKTQSHPQPAQLVAASAGVSPVLAYKSSDSVQQRPVESCAQQQRQQQLHNRPQLHPHPHPLQHQQQQRQHNIPAMAQQLPQHLQHHQQQLHKQQQMHQQQQMQQQLHLQHHQQKQMQQHHQMLQQQKHLQQQQQQQQQMQQQRQKAATFSSPLGQYVPQAAPGPGLYRGPATLPLPVVSSGPSVVPLPGQSPVQTAALQTASVPAEVRRSSSGSLQEVIRSASGSGAQPQEVRRSSSGSLTSPDPSQGPPPVIIRPRAFCREVPPEPSAAKPRAAPQEVTAFMPRGAAMARPQEAAAPQPGPGAGLARRQAAVDPTSAAVRSILEADTLRAR